MTRQAIRFVIPRYLGALMRTASSAKRPPKSRTSPYDRRTHNLAEIAWKTTGNLGGEDRVDIARGPLSEGGMYAKRKARFSSAFPSRESGNPTEQVSKLGIRYDVLYYHVVRPR